MDPVTAAILLSGGINALQGKRGSDLLKSTISDAALAYATGGAGEAEGISTLEGIDDLGQVGINQYANTGIAQQLGNTALQGETFAARDAMNAGDYMQYAKQVGQFYEEDLDTDVSFAELTDDVSANKVKSTIKI